MNTSMKLKPLTTLASAACLLVAGAALFAQNETSTPSQPPPDGIGNAHLWAEVGSFKLEGNGTVDVKFTGTLLISRAEGQPMPQVSLQGNVRKEFESEEMGRTAWFGSGSARISGAWRHLTVFGKQMDAKWRGRGIAMVYGEFDAQGKTGFITVDGSEPFEWMNAGMTFHVPASADPRIQQQPREQNPRMPSPAPTNPQPLQGR
jgi:hypothetical protein